MQFNPANHWTKNNYSSQEMCFNVFKMEKTVVKYVWPPAIKQTINAFLLKNYFNILGKYL